jgi:hypothetical protein
MLTLSTGAGKALDVAKPQIAVFTIGTSGRLLTHESATGHQKGEIIVKRSSWIIIESTVIIFL